MVESAFADGRKRVSINLDVLKEYCKKYAGDGPFEDQCGKASHRMMKGLTKLKKKGHALQRKWSRKQLDTAIIKGEACQRNYLKEAKEKVIFRFPWHGTV